MSSKRAHLSLTLKLAQHITARVLCTRMPMGANAPQMHTCAHNTCCVLATKAPPPLTHSSSVYNSCSMLHALLHVPTHNRPAGPHHDVTGARACSPPPHCLTVHLQPPPHSLSICSPQVSIMPRPWLTSSPADSWMKPALSCTVARASVHACARVSAQEGEREGRRERRKQYVRHVAGVTVATRQV